MLSACTTDLTNSVSPSQQPGASVSPVQTAEPSHSPSQLPSQSPSPSHAEDSPDIPEPDDDDHVEMASGSGPETPDITPASLLRDDTAPYDLVVHFIDVGQADCIFIELPGSQMMLIDGGNRSGTKKIMNYLKSRNVEKLDFLVVTHPHEDHIGALPEVIKTFDIGEVYIPKVSHNTQIFERVLTSVKNKGLEISTAKAGVTILSTPELTIEIVAPVRESYKAINDYSTIVRLTYKEVSFLFTGDVEVLSENDVTADVRADVLKVAHHGSSTSSSAAFLQKVAPTIAVIFVGDGNSYGHPSDTILSRLDSLGATIYRTDESGTIIVSTNGSDIEVNANTTTQTTVNPLDTPAPSASPSQSPSLDLSDDLDDDYDDIYDYDDIVVYITRTGARYHLESCRFLGESKGAVLLEDIRQSHTACAVCNPPG